MNNKQIYKDILTLCEAIEIILGTAKDIEQLNNFTIIRKNLKIITTLLTKLLQKNNED